MRDRAFSSDDPSGTATGLTIRDVARRYRISPDKVRGWVRSGQLAAINVASTLCGRPRWIILPAALAEFEQKRAGGPPPKAPLRRKATGVDFYPG